MPYDAETYTPATYTPPKNPLAPRFQRRARKLAAHIRSLDAYAYNWGDATACLIGWSRRTGGPLAWLTPGRYLGFSPRQTASVYSGMFGAANCDTPNRAADVLERWADTGQLTPNRSHYR